MFPQTKSRCDSDRRAKLQTEFKEKCIERVTEK